MDTTASATICRKAWWQQQRSGVYAVPADTCACLGFGCFGTIACEKEAAAPAPTMSPTEFGNR
ncbi:MAG: hypothetical protein JO021_22275 [Alphaproteobacteria bacterium]|nr:hypothetical protein [Alphaproteobacteria bacterium]